jgi:hypothetical protein
VQHDMLRRAGCMTAWAGSPAVVLAEERRVGGVLHATQAAYAACGACTIHIGPSDT